MAKERKLDRLWRELQSAIDAKGKASADFSVSETRLSEAKARVREAREALNDELEFYE
jgi:ATP phosphoribosyltransferase